MLTATESKVVISTLTKRRSWLKKNLEDSNLDPAVRKDHTNTLLALESAMKKIAAVPLTAPAPAANEVAAKSPSKQQNKALTIETLKILVAEDQEESREILVTILQDIGIKLVDAAVDGRDAFDKIKSASTPYDVILCDWDMPELSGLEVHQKAKASKTLRGAHFCMVTGVSEAMRIREAIQQGVNDYVVKPVDPDILEGKLKATIQEKNAN